MNTPDPVATGIVTAGALQLAKQAQDFIAAASGHPGESLGKILGDWSRRRMQNVEAVGNKARLILLNLGVEPKPTPLKVIQPLLEAASLEEEPDIQEMWAAMLANAASPENAGKVRPGFIALLKQMSHDEAAMLNWIFSQRTGVAAGPFDDPISFEDLLVAHSSLGLQIASDPLHLDTCLQSLQAEQLIEPRPDVLTIGRLHPSYSLTFRGLSFMYACRAPAGNSESRLSL